MAEDDGVDRMHVLVAPAKGRVAGWQVQVEYWESIARVWREAGEPLPEVLAGRIEHAERELAFSRGVCTRLEGKLATEEEAQATTVNASHA